MRIYLFNPENGVYQGEDFADDPPMREGRTAVPAHATAVAPPPYGQAEVPVFTVAENKWEIRPVSAAVTAGDGAPSGQKSRLAKYQMFRRANRQGSGSH